MLLFYCKSSDSNTISISACLTCLSIFAFIFPLENALSITKVNEESKRIAKVFQLILTTDMFFFIVLILVNRMSLEAKIRSMKFFVCMHVLTHTYTLALMNKIFEK